MDKSSRERESTISFPLINGLDHATRFVQLIEIFHEELASVGSQIPLWPLIAAVRREPR